MSEKDRLKVEPGFQNTPQKGFDRKQFAEVFNDQKQAHQFQKTDTFISERGIGNPQMPRSQTNPNVSINYAPKGLPRQLSEESRNSIIQEEFGNILNSQTFAENVLKLNKNLEETLLQEIKTVIFNEQKKYIEQLIGENLNYKIQKEMTDFKLNFSSFFEDVIRTKSMAMSENRDESILKLEQEVAELKKAKRESEETKSNNQQSQLLSEVRLLKQEMSEMRLSLEVLRSNEQRIEQEMENSKNVLNPNQSYIEEISLLKSSKKNGRDSIDSHGFGTGN